MRIGAPARGLEWGRLVLRLHRLHDLLSLVRDRGARTCAFGRFVSAAWRVSFPMSPISVTIFQRPFSAVLALSAAWLLMACQPAQEHISGPTMGSTYSLRYVREDSAHTPDVVQALVQQVLVEVDEAVSTYRSDSALARFNAAPAPVCMEMPEAALAMWHYAQSLHADSLGAFDATLLPALQAWGFGPQAVAHHTALPQAGMKLTDLANAATTDDGHEGAPDAAALHALRSQVGMQHVWAQDRQLCKTAAVALEFNSIAAGYAIDRIVGRLHELGIRRYLLDVTGELRAGGTRADGAVWRVAIEAPPPQSAGAVALSRTDVGGGAEALDEGPLTPLSDVRPVQKILTLADMALSTSGDYRQYREHGGRRLSHIMDARTLSPVTHRLASVTVAAPTAMQADGLSTLLMVLGPDVGLQYARQHNLAAFFIVRTDAGVQTRSTPAFDAVAGASAAP